MKKSNKFSPEVCDRSVRIVQFVLLHTCIALTACGGGEATTEQTASARSAGADRTQMDAPDLSATDAPSRSSASLPDAPTLADAPPAPIEGQHSRQSSSPTVNLNFSEKTAQQSASPPIPSIVRRKIVGGLIEPTDLVAANDGTLFYTERGRGLFALRPGADSVLVFAPRELELTSRSGVFAVTLDPEFSRNRFVYVLMRTSGAGTETSLVVRLSLDAAYTHATNRSDILVVPTTVGSDRGRQGSSTFGARLRFGPDGYLYVGLADDFQSATPQPTQALAGKLLRIDRDGHPAPNNKAPAGFDKRVYSSGIRDAVAIAFHPNTEAVLVGRRNQAAPDEVVIEQSSANRELSTRCAPPKTGHCDRSSGQIGEVIANGFVSVWRGGNEAAGLTAIELLRDPVWGAWRNAFAVAFDQGQRIDFIKIDSMGRTVRAATVVEKLGVGFKAVVERPDGLYAMTRGRPGGDEIWRLSPQ